MFKNWTQRVKEKFLAPELTLVDAKVFAMLAVIYSDDKAKMDQEMRLFKVLCTFDRRLSDIDVERYIEPFEKHRYNLDTLFEQLAESIFDRDRRMDLLASVSLLASIDGYISKEEAQLLDRLAKILRMTLEDIQTVEQQTQFIVKTLNEHHRFEPSATHEGPISVADAKIVVMLLVIYADPQTEKNDRALSLLATLCTLGDQSSNYHFETLQAEYEEYKDQPTELFQILANASLSVGEKLDLLTSAYLFAQIDEGLSKVASRTILRLANALKISTETKQTAKANAQSLVDTMKELRILA